jgi:uncharacterized membrane protein
MRERNDPICDFDAGTANGASGNSGKPVFSATLTPHCSFGPEGFGVLMALVGGACFAASLVFWSLGAWPVAGFLGLDVAIIWLAFKLNFRAARVFEEITVSPTALTIRKVTPGSRVREICFNPFWARLEVTDHGEDGVSAIIVRARGEAVRVGAFLNPGDRKSLARAFGAALAEARR